jgi:hypothetical protein
MVILKLLPHNRKYRRPKSEMLANLKCTPDSAKEALTRYIAGTGTRDDAIFECLGLLQYQVGRFLGKWPFLSAYEDDMVSEGMVAVIRAIDALTEKHTEPVGYVTNRIIRKIARHLNSLLSATGTSEDTQYKLLRENSPCVPSTEAHDIDTAKDTDTCGEELVQLIEIIRAACNDDLDRFIVNPNNSSMSDHELAKMFGVHRNTIVNRRAALLKRVEEKLNV